MHFLKKGQKIRAWVDPPLILAMPERKRFFSVDVFPNASFQGLALVLPGSCSYNKKYLLWYLEVPVPWKAHVLEALVTFLRLAIAVSHTGRKPSVIKSDSLFNTFCLRIEKY